MNMAWLGVVIVFTGAVAGTALGDDRVQILEIGLWHGQEVDVQAHADWWGIFPEGDGYELQQAPVSVSVAYDAVLDDESEKTGKQITVPQAADPVFLVRGIRGLTQGPLEVAAVKPQEGAIIVGKTMDLRLPLESGPERSGLYARGKRLTFSGPGDVGQENLEIIIYEERDGKRTEQTLAHIPGQTDGSPRLEWAGDLDRDGKVDVLVDVTNHYNVRHWVLFLSRAAKEGELVGRVAEWRTTGC